MTAKLLQLVKTEHFLRKQASLFLSFSAAFPDFSLRGIRPLGDAIIAVYESSYKEIEISFSSAGARIDYYDGDGHYYDATKLETICNEDIIAATKILYERALEENIGDGS